MTKGKWVKKKEKYPPNQPRNAVLFCSCKRHLLHFCRLKLALSLLQSFFAHWGVVHATKTALKSHKSDGFCCCPVFSALITTEPPVQKNRGSLQRRELKSVKKELFLGSLQTLISQLIVLTPVFIWSFSSYNKTAWIYRKKRISILNLCQGLSLFLVYRSAEGRKKINTAFRSD